MSTKKHIERFYLDQLFETIGMTPEDVKSGESPDFVVTLRERRIGIEVTEFHSASKGEDGRPRRALEEDWNVLQRMIMEKVGQHPELDKTKGLIFFKNLELPPRRDRKRFVEELSRLALEMSKSGCTDMKPGSEFSVLGRFVERFHLEDAGCYITWEWNQNAAWVGLNEDEMIEAISDKITKSHGYRQSDLDELWLLVVSGHRLSQSTGGFLLFKLNSFHEVDAILRRSAFDRVYVFQYMFGVAFQWPGWVQIGTEERIPTITTDTKS